ncbi:hypothetical protein JKP88DRAFT_216542 [Tribonema minus]|uniref:S1 motif domain-containing protein n=1 Tax=Tribonema minus TaxID=303371 RepID=A0A835YI70_9STRA|nr:hypothetical protein JKP88DRAFT_216542 [Tribonema minus]
MASTQLACPGDRLGRASEFTSGPGTYTRGPHIFASLVGPVLQQEGAEGGLPVITVRGGRNAQDQVIEVGDVVMARVTRVRALLASVEILCAGETVLREAYNGIIKKEDVRATEVDRVDMGQSFRPGDIVRARVSSLGDARQYYLTTAAPDLGVRWAKSDASGAIMVPVSWQEMQCPVTGVREPRKCARPDAS